MKDSSDATVLYHGGGCRDGFCAAWCMRRAFPAAEFIPVNYGGPFPDTAHRRVFLVDFCYEADHLCGLVAFNESVVVIDHHATAEATLRETAAKIGVGDKFDFIFNKNRSGAMLAWEYAAGVAGTHDGGMPPWFVAYVEDRDLWAWKLPHSREINAALRLVPLDFAAWDALQFKDEAMMIDQGRAVLLRDAEIVDSHVRNAKSMDIAGHSVPCVNATTLMSEIGQALCVGKPFSATYFDNGSGLRIWSLRSDVNGLDVSAVAKSLGGGGHKHTAGFQTNVDPPKAM